MGSQDIPESQRGWIAHLMTNALRTRGATEIEYDAEQRRMRFRSPAGSPVTAHLDRLFRECVTASADERAARIAHFVDAMLTTPESPSTWDDAAARLRPVLRPARYAHESDAPGQPPLVRPFQPLLNEMVVIDQPNVMAYLNVKMVRDWGVSEALVFDRARANLDADLARPPPRGDRPPVFRFLETGHEYWSSRLLIDGWLSAMSGWTGGRPVAFLPDMSGLTIAKDEPEVIGRLLETNERQYLEASRPQTPQAYTVDDTGRVVPYSVPPGHPLWISVHRTEVLFAFREYATQKEIRDGDPRVGSIATLQARKRPDGAVFSLTEWGEEFIGLLPQADYVAFVNDTDSFRVPWEIVARETGLVPEPGWSPVRYRVHGWPDPPVLARLRAAATAQ